MRSWLREIREKYNMTQEQVAFKAGISRSYFTNIENGTKTPSVIAAKSIGEALDFPWSYFFEEKCYFKEQKYKEGVS
ncbi:helix-turn-helix transcriptional regulator [Paenibacillus tundrae]|uniref:helix-turn-helix transcriptional regulator n=1 Tax=Paenibacillus tundrae TaxID=528187 RepID=UPI0030CD3A7D